MYLWHTPMGASSVCFTSKMVTANVFWDSLERLALSKPIRSAATVHKDYLVSSSYILSVMRGIVSAGNGHLLRVSEICPRLATFWPFYIHRCTYIGANAEPRTIPRY